MSLPTHALGNSQINGEAVGQLVHFAQGAHPRYRIVAVALGRASFGRCGRAPVVGEVVGDSAGEGGALDRGAVVLCPVAHAVAGLGGVGCAFGCSFFAFRGVKRIPEASSGS